MKPAVEQRIIVQPPAAPRAVDPLGDSRALLASFAAPYDDAEVEAVKAVAKGNASPGQQQLAMQWIVHKAARTYDEPFIPGHGDLTIHLMGRRNVGMQIIKLVNVPVKKLVPARKPVKPQRKEP